ncbi:hypothetical protein LTR27_005934 [Elasticomyces elasticus]|nr:hypothetical protein LTR27_005934 [Elasticomyces elasticus]
MDTAQPNGNSIYAPIDTQAQEVRLLLLAPGGETDVPTGVLLHYTLDDCPAYTALSYTWGDLSFKIPITVNGCPFMVTENLYAALETIRAPNEEVLLWIDAISIEQDNLDERSKHVIYMHIVYQQAVSVIVWFGRASEDSDVAFDQIEAICERCWPWPENEREMDGKFASAFESVVTARQHHRADHDPWKPLANLFTRPWWQRIWIVQEVAFGHPLKVMCGHRTTSMAHILLVGEASRQLRLQSSNMLAQDSREAADSSYIGILARLVVPTQLLSYQTVPGGAKDLSLEYALTKLARNRACSDPRDKVFGLLNLVARDQWPCEPGYQRDVKEVFKLAMLKIVELRNDLSILASCEAEIKGVWPFSTRTLRKFVRTAHLADLPSCIPDWTAVRHTFPLPGGTGNDDAYLTSSHFRFRVVGDTMLVRGLILGTIQHVSDFYVGRNHDVRDLSTYQQLGSFLATYGDQTSSNEPIVEAARIQE